MIFKEEKDLIKIKIPYSCGEIEWELMEMKFDHQEEPEYFFDFKISAFDAGQSIIGLIKERIKLAWLSLRKGNYYFQSMEIKKELLEQLRDDLNYLFNNKVL